MQGCKEGPSYHQKWKVHYPKKPNQVLFFKSKVVGVQPALVLGPFMISGPFVIHQDIQSTFWVSILYFFCGCSILRMGEYSGGGTGPNFVSILSSRSFTLGQICSNIGITSNFSGQEQICLLGKQALYKIQFIRSKFYSFDIKKTESYSEIRKK